MSRGPEDMVVLDGCPFQINLLAHAGVSSGKMQHTFGT